MRNYPGGVELQIRRTGVGKISKGKKSKLGELGGKEKTGG